MSAVVFLDRDGTIIVDQHYPKEASLVSFLPHAVEGLRALREKGYRLVVVSNQSGVGRGLISDQQFREVHERFCQLLKEEKIEVDQYLYCLHHPEDPCHCRKPKTGLIPKSVAGEAIDFSKSVTVGDRKSDMELGKALGTRTYLILTGKGEDTEKELSERELEESYSVALDLLQVANLLPEVSASKST